MYVCMYVYIYTYHYKASSICTSLLLQDMHKCRAFGSGSCPFFNVYSVLVTTLLFAWLLLMDVVTGLSCVPS